MDISYQYGISVVPPHPHEAIPHYITKPWGERYGPVTSFDLDNMNHEKELDYALKKLVPD